MISVWFEPENVGKSSKVRRKSPCSPHTAGRTEDDAADEADVVVEVVSSVLDGAEPAPLTKPVPNEDRS